MYKFGEAFCRWVAETYGEEALLALIDNAWRDVDFRKVAEVVLHGEWPALSAEWTDWVRAQYLRELPETTSPTLASPAVAARGFNFKPVVRTQEAAPAAPRPKGTFPLTLVNRDNKPLGGTCMTSAGAGGGQGKACDSCNVLDSEMTKLRNEIKRHGFPTPDGVHNGPCHVHMQHAHTIGPDGSLYACPGFTGELSQSTGHIDDRRDPLGDSRCEHGGADRRAGDGRR